MYRTFEARGLLMLATTVAAQQNTLTEETTIRLGLSRGPVQQRTEGNTTQAQSDVIAAGKVPNPEFHYEREPLGNDNEAVKDE